MVPQHKVSLPDLDASSLRLQSSSTPSKQFAQSPSEELTNYAHASLPSQPPFSMHLSSLHDQRESLVDPWLPSADVTQPADTSFTLSKSIYSPSLTVNCTTPLNDPACRTHFLLTPGDSLYARHQSFPSQLNVTPVTPPPRLASFSVDRRSSTAGSAASSGREPRGDIFAEPLREITVVTPAHGLCPSIGTLVDFSKWPSLLDLPPITAGDQITSPVEPCHSAFSNPFSEHDFATRSTSLGVVDVDPLSPPSSLVSIARPVASEKEHDAVIPDPSVSKASSFVSLPGTSVRKRPRRRDIERLYGSWSGSSKGYGTRIHLDAHIIMQPHRSKRSSAGEIHGILRDLNCTI